MFWGWCLEMERGWIEVCGGWQGRGVGGGGKGEGGGGERCLGDGRVEVYGEGV
jgi:hypothetical protein